MENLYTQKVININNIFDNRFIDTKTLFLYRFNRLPSLSFVNQINGEKAFHAFKEKFADLLLDIHQYRWYEARQKKYEFDKTVIVLRNKCILEFDDDYCEIMHDGTDSQFVEQLTATLGQFRQRQRKQPLEINLIITERNSLQLKAMEIKKTKLDLDLFYEDDFKAIDDIIRKRLSKKRDKGIVLLHGLPGTGKTTYLRHLVGRIRKRVLFLSPGVAGNLMNPEFIELLIDNPDSVLVIEDAENIIMDRRHNSTSSVSNLLNISDGLLADFLNVQLVCTFNSPIALVDEALLRKGRLIARYEFGKLGIEKANRLSRHFGFDGCLDKPMTIAEIANQHERTHKGEQVEVIGFRRQYEVMN